MTSTVETPSGGEEPGPDLLDRYLAAIQAGDSVLEQRLRADHPLLAAWTACLRGLDDLGSSFGMALPPPAEESLTGRRFGPFVIGPELGRGGMGVVYRARHADLGRDVALKLLAAGVYATPEQRRRFLAEARLAGRIRHPRIVAIHDAGERDGQLYFAMDLVAGTDLATRLRAGPLPARQAAEILAAVAGAVQHLHANGILHRDLKPSNVLLDAGGSPQLADFGLARDDRADGGTATGTVLGTPEYMPPEQAAGRSVDNRADVYGLGAVLYALVTGRPPFSGETRLLALMNVLEREPVPPRRLRTNVPLPLERICLRCLEKDPARRYPTAAAVAADLEAWLRGDRVAPPRGGPLHRLGRVIRRYPAAGFRVSGILGTLCVVAIRCLVAPETIDFYRPIGAGLVLWATCTAFWEWIGLRRAAARWTGHAFVLTDAMFVTALLVIARAADGPLVAVHPVLVAASGLWLDRRLVRVAAAASLIGYAALLGVAGAGVRWHIATIVALLVVCTAAITDFQVGRLRRG
jgi:eukaryotic-like serine/threonine-protein kinase